MELPELLSSYGVTGRSKLLVGPTGNIMITKDGSQLLPVMSKKSTLVMEKMVLQMCVDHGDRYGDGSITQVLLATTFLQSFNDVLRDNNVSQRNLYVRALSIVNHVFHVFRQDIQDVFLSNGLWRDLSLTSDVVYNICHTIIQPAANAGVARNLSRVIVAWCQEVLSCAQGWCICESATDLLRHFDNFVFTSFTGNISESYIVPYDTVVFEGRFKNISTITKSPFRYVCVHFLEHDSQLHISLQELAHTSQLRQACMSLSQHIDVIFCHGSVSDAELCVLSQCGLNVVRKNLV